jgi:hypothetical protein
VLTQGLITLNKMKLATYDWWFATLEAEDIGQSDPGFPPVLSNEPNQIALPWKSSLPR